MATPITVPLTTASGVRDIYIAEERYALIATSGGIDVVDLFEGRLISSGTLPSEPVSIAADWRTPAGRLYVGTAASGIFDMNYVLVRNVGSDFTGDLVQRFTTLTSPPVSDNRINDLDVSSGLLLIGTDTGVDFIVDSSEYATRALTSGSHSVRLTKTGGGYWTTNSGVADGAVESNYNLLSTTGTSIIDVAFEYTASTIPALPSEPPLDITVSEVSGQLPIIGVATPGGALVFEELQGNESAANNKVLTNESLVSVDFSRGAFYTSGCLYAVTEEIARVFDLATNSVVGTHTDTQGTRGITLVTGTNVLIRSINAGLCPPV